MEILLLTARSKSMSTNVTKPGADEKNLKKEASWSCTTEKCLMEQMEGLLQLPSDFYLNRWHLQVQILGEVKKKEAFEMSSYNFADQIGAVISHTCVTRAQHVRQITKPSLWKYFPTYVGRFSFWVWEGVCGVILIYEALWVAM